MSNRLKINPKLYNKAEIARKAGYTTEYVRLLLLGKRKNKAALQKVMNAIKELKTAA